MYDTSSGIDLSQEIVRYKTSHNSKTPYQRGKIWSPSLSSRNPKHTKTQFLCRGDFCAIFYRPSLDPLRFKIKLVCIEHINSFIHFWQRVTKSYQVTIAGQRNLTSEAIFALQHAAWAKRTAHKYCLFSKQGTDAGRLPYFYELLFKNAGYMKECGGLSRSHWLNANNKIMYFVELHPSQWLSCSTNTPVLTFKCTICSVVTSINQASTRSRVITHSPCSGSVRMESTYDGFTSVVNGTTPHYRTEGELNMTCLP